MSVISEQIKQEFIQIVGVQNYEDSSASKLVYSFDATPGFQAMPDAVISPRNKDEVARVVKVCHVHSIPIVPRGAGTNLSAGTTPLAGGIVLLFKHLDQIIELDEANLTVTVQPGVNTLELIQFVEERGLFYPPDPSSMKISQIGGNISENSGGLRGLKYGVTRDYVLGLEVVLANGEVIRTGGKLAKDVAGYDLTSLMVGSEGTLGIVTEAILKLIPKPETIQTALALFDSMDAAARAVSKIIAERVIPATLEFLDRPTLQVVEDYSQIGLPTDVEAVLLIEQDGVADQVQQDMEKIVRICEEAGAQSVRLAQSAVEAEQLRTARRSALSALARLKPTTILEDATVPRSEIATMVKKINEIALHYRIKICTFGHAGDGNLHPTCLTDARDKDEMERVEQALEDIFTAAIELGGTITGEHGVGAMKAPYLHLKLGEEGIAAMKAIKTGLDPKNILNPNKIFAKSNRKRVVVGVE